MPSDRMRVTMAQADKNGTLAGSAAGSLEEIVRVDGEVAGEIASIADTIREVNIAAEQSAGSCDELAKMVDQLNASMARFQV